MGKFKQDLENIKNISLKNYQNISLKNYQKKTNLD